MGRTSRVRRRLHRKSTHEEGNFLPDLYKYMHSKGWKNESQLTVRDFSETGRGICYKQTQINNHDNIIIKVPIKSFITIATLETDDDFKQVFSSVEFSEENRINFQELLALYLCYQNHLQQRSPLYAYLQTIPRSFTNPYFCTLDEMRCLPEELLEKIIAQKTTIKTSYANLRKILATNHCACCGLHFLDVTFTIQLYEWAYFAVNSRTVHLSTNYVTTNNGVFFKKLLNNAPTMALAPFLDMANHSDKINTCPMVIANDKNELEFMIKLERSSLPTKPFEQLYISYGMCTNFRLLTDYGFSLPGNRHEVFTITLSDIEKFIKAGKNGYGYSFHRNKFKFIRDHNLHDAMLIIFDEGMSHNLHLVLHLLFKVESYFPNILSEIAFGDAQQLADVQLELNLLLEYKISEYTTFLQQLSRLNTLTASATMAKNYLTECIEFLKMYIS
ncbi:SET domain-containing protein 4 [Teleopsis dalmanni]|uniref:SET domain-containing protein 4 n=1 Tax=Teleopsis dalmanni TaxID=139649 RepID=UPI0018CEAA34|nr:SET domain-containing protein 4 [Teleopsis dalmanni]